MKKKTCCFSGHRNLPSSKRETIAERLNEEIEKLIMSGVKDFISGAALGFDLMAASIVTDKKERGENVKLIFALPCKNHDLLWNEGQKKWYRALRQKADEVIYVSDRYDSCCMKRRNEYMVARSAHCIYALTHEKSGTGQTVRLARKNGLSLIRIGF